MGVIVTPGSPITERAPYLALANSPQDYRRVADAFVRILKASFDEDARRSGQAFADRVHTQGEERRRARILGKWFRELRNSGFSTSRTLDEVQRALRTELDGGTYTPPEGNRLWAPGGALQ